MVRGVDTGPWDVRENGWQSTRLIDLGGLLIPDEDGIEVQLGATRASSDLVSVTVLRDSCGLQLQAFHAMRSGAWDRARTKLLSNTSNPKNRFLERDGRFGAELRCEIEAETAWGRREMTAVCFLGCEGPGWLLRGVLSGAIAFDEPPAEWFSFYLGRVVVAPSKGRPLVSASPTGFGSLQTDLDGKPILLRLPD